jgi:hypothetical protein
VANRTAPVDALTLVQPAPPAPAPRPADRVFLISADLLAYQRWHAEGKATGWDEPPGDNPVPGVDLVVDVCRVRDGRLVAGSSRDASYEKASWVYGAWEQSPPLPLSDVLAAAGLNPRRRLPTVLTGLDARAFVKALTDLWDTDLDNVDGTLRTSSTRERSAVLRAAKLLGHGSMCEGCGFDYGSIPDGVGLAALEVHHLTPLGGAEPTLTRLADLTVICASCHRIVHGGGRSGAVLTIDALRAARGSDERGGSKLL